MFRRSQLKLLINISKPPAVLFLFSVRNCAIETVARKTDTAQRWKPTIGRPLRLGVS